MNDPFDRHAVIISSAGRTGTQFLANTMSRMIPESVSLHEPGSPWFTRPGKLLRDMAIWGPWAMTGGQASPRHGVYRLSTARFTGEVSDDAAAATIVKLRKGLLKRIGTPTYIESSGHLWALLDLLPLVFSSCRVVFIVRDPRTWITSALNTPEYYLYGPFDERLGISIRADRAGGDPYGTAWRSMDRFQKYCWFYRAMHDFIIPRIERMQNVRIMRYEDLFDPDTRARVFPEMLRFAAAGTVRDERIDFRPELLSRRVGSNAAKARGRGFRGWREWTRDEAGFMAECCGAMMQRFGYGREEEWHRLTEGACVRPSPAVYSPS